MLLQTIQEIKTFLPIGVGNDFNRLKPHIANAETKYIIPLIGNVMYEELQEFHDNMPLQNPTEVQELTLKLLKKVQHATIHLAYFVGYDFLNVSVTDSGFKRLESDSKKGLYKYQEDNLKQYFSDAGFNTLDSILVFLEKNIESFSEFKASPNWTVLKSSFLPTVKVVEDIPYNIFGSRLTFLNLKPHVAFVQDTTIRIYLGEAIYQEILAEMVKDTPAPKVTAILPYIRKPLIYLSVAMLMEETGATLGNHGLYFEKLNSVNPDNRIKQPSSEERIAALVSRNRNIGNAYLDSLKSFLINNIEDWVDFTGNIGSAFSRNNYEKKTFWA